MLERQNAFLGNFRIATVFIKDGWPFRTSIEIESFYCTRALLLSSQREMPASNLLQPGSSSADTSESADRKRREEHCDADQHCGMRQGPPVKRHGECAEDQLL